ncbi:MAG: Smr/MutS family protein [Polyangiaceae bacterium]
MTGKKKDAGPFETLRSLRDDLVRKAKQEEASSASEQRTGGNKPPAPSSMKKAKKAPASPRNSTPDGPEDEALLLHRMFAGVRPLARPYERVSKQAIERSTSVDNLAQRGREVAAAEAEAVHEHLRALVEGKARFEVTDDGLRVEGRRSDVPLDVLRRLRRGLMPIDSRVDLHGLSASEARAQIETFLATMRARHERCVLIIHGKGLHSPSGASVLRGEITAWLSQGQVSQHVAAFATADAQDGGEGATYVLLRT